MAGGPRWGVHGVEPEALKLYGPGPFEDIPGFYKSADAKAAANALVQEAGLESPTGRSNVPEVLQQYVQYAESAAGMSKRVAAMVLGGVGAGLSGALPEAEVHAPSFLTGAIMGCGITGALAVFYTMFMGGFKGGLFEDEQVGRRWCLLFKFMKTCSQGEEDEKEFHYTQI